MKLSLIPGPWHRWIWMASIWNQVMKHHISIGCLGFSFPTQAQKDGRLPTALPRKCWFHLAGHFPRSERLPLCRIWQLLGRQWWLQMPCARNKRLKRHSAEMGCSCVSNSKRQVWYTRKWPFRVSAVELGTPPVCVLISSNFCIRALVSFVGMCNWGLFKPLNSFSSQMTLDGWNELGMLGQAPPCGCYSVKARHGVLTYLEYIFI